MKRYASAVLLVLASALVTLMFARHHYLMPAETNIEIQGRCVNGQLQLLIGASGPGVTGIAVPLGVCGESV